LNANAIRHAIIVKLGGKLILVVACAARENEESDVVVLGYDLRPGTVEVRTHNHSRKAGDFAGQDELRGGMVLRRA
jgi:hypothetical protein